MQHKGLSSLCYFYQPVKQIENPTSNNQAVRNSRVNTLSNYNSQHISYLLTYAYFMYSIYLINR